MCTYKSTGNKANESTSVSGGKIQLQYEYKQRAIGLRGEGAYVPGKAAESKRQLNFN